MEFDIEAAHRMGIVRTQTALVTTYTETQTNWLSIRFTTPVLMVRQWSTRFLNNFGSRPIRVSIQKWDTSQ